MKKVFVHKGIAYVEGQMIGTVGENVARANPELFVMMDDDVPPTFFEEWKKSVTESKLRVQKQRDRGSNKQNYSRLRSLDELDELEPSSRR